MKVLTHKRKTLEECIKEIESWDISKDERDSIKKFLNEYLSGRVTSRIGNNPDGLVESLTNCLKVSVVNIKDCSKENNIRKFFDDIMKDKIKKMNRKTLAYNGEAYSLRHKIEIINTLKRFVKWRYPDKPELLVSLNIRIQQKQKDDDYLTLQEIDTLYKDCKSNKERYILAGLFSTGCRAEEFLNLRICDYDLPKGDEFIKATIRGETSKTKGRTISLYYPKVFEAVQDYISELKKNGSNPTDLVLEGYSYEALRYFIGYLGEKSLKKNIHVHLFRGSCATWLASKLNRQQLCVYFGWAFSSNMPDKYISRAGVNMKEVDDKVRTDNFQDIQVQLEKEKFEKREMKEQIEELKKQLGEVQPLIDSKAKQDALIKSYAKEVMDDILKKAELKYGPKHQK